MRPESRHFLVGTFPPTVLGLANATTDYWFGTQALVPNVPNMRLLFERNKFPQAPTGGLLDTENRGKQVSLRFDGLQAPWKLKLEFTFVFHLNEAFWGTGETTTGNVPNWKKLFRLWYYVLTPKKSSVGTDQGEVQNEFGAHRNYGRPLRIGHDFENLVAQPCEINDIGAAARTGRAVQLNKGLWNVHKRGMINWPQGSPQQASFKLTWNYTAAMNDMTFTPDGRYLSQWVNHRIPRVLVVHNSTVQAINMDVLVKGWYAQYTEPIFVPDPDPQALWDIEPTFNAGNMGTWYGQGTPNGTVNWGVKSMNPPSLAP